MTEELKPCGKVDCEHYRIIKKGTIQEEPLRRAWFLSEEFMHECIYCLHWGGFDNYKKVKEKTHETYRPEENES